MRDEVYDIHIYKYPWEERSSLILLCRFQLRFNEANLKSKDIIVKINLSLRGEKIA
jgi:hypothetical protein